MAQQGKQPLCSELAITSQTPGLVAVHNRGSRCQWEGAVSGCAWPGQHTGALAPSTAHICSHSLPLLCSPLRRTRRHLDALGRKKNAVIYFPTCIGLTSLLVFAAGTDLCAGEGTAHTDPDTQLRFSDAQHRVLQGLKMPLSITCLE